jgi:hypothetical protein
MKEYQKVPKVDPPRPWPDPPEKMPPAKIRLVIETEPPPDGGRDFAPKEFDGFKAISNVLEIFVTALRRDPNPGGRLMWCGRPILNVQITQEREPDGIHTATSSEVDKGDEPGKGTG